MSNDKLKLTRRKALTGLGGIGIGAALSGAGTMAYFNDTEKSKNNTVTAGKLDLQLDWKQAYYQGMHGSGESSSEPTNNPGPIFEISDAKPGDCGYGYISVHNYYNPAYVWAGCDLKEWENYRKEPERKVDDTPHEGELAENIKVALLRFPYIENTNNNDTNTTASDQTEVHEDLEAEVKNGRDFDSIDNCTPIFVTTLKDLCENGLHGGYLLDGKPEESGKCFRQSHTYFYGFAWWIPKTVGNIIQSDSVKFDLKFGAVQCRHLSKEKAHNYNPFDGNNAQSSEATTTTSSE